MNKMFFLYLKDKTEKVDLMDVNRQKDALKKNGIFVDGKTYTVKFKGKELKLVKWCCW